MAGGYELLKLVAADGGNAPWGAMALGTVIAAITGYLCIAWLLRVINRIGLAPFAIYRFLVAALLFWLFA
jgi:undecaprenyl-diphosphatase